MLPDRAADLVRELVKDLAVVVSRNVLPESTEQTAVRVRNVHDRHRFQPERRGEVHLEERF